MRSTTKSTEHAVQVSQPFCLTYTRRVDGVLKVQVHYFPDQLSTDSVEEQMVFLLGNDHV